MGILHPGSILAPLAVANLITVGNTIRIMKSKQTTVSAKIPKQLKEELERKGVNMSEAIRKGLERELKEMKTKELESILRGIDFSKISEERIVRDLRETREEH